MFSRPLYGSSARQTGETMADSIARQYAGNEQPGIPPCIFTSSPGQVAMQPSIAHPDGGWAWGPEVSPRTR